jgi:hypothetical protein
MINYWNLAANSLWILGLAILLAALSWASWTARTEQVRFRAALSRAGLQQTIDLGLALFCAGLAATSDTWWEQLLWGLLVLAWLTQALLARRRAASE